MKLLSAANMEPTKYALDKWRSLGFLPSKVAVLLLFECQRLGVETTESDLRWRNEAEVA